MIFHKLNKPFVSRTKAVMSTSQLLKNNKKEFIKSTRNLSTFGGIEEGKKDAIFGLHEQFERDSDVKKVDLTIGSYKDDNGESYVFPSVKAAEISIVDKNLKMDYLPISGNRGFLKHALYLMYGKDNNVLMENRVAAIQSLSGTGALRTAFDFLKKLVASDQTTVHLSDPSYANHIPILSSAGFKNIKKFSYFDADSNSLNFAQMKKDIEKASPGDILLLQAIAHNPTGTDPSQQQWKVLSKLCKSKNLVVVFDFAYQGFVSGDPDTDAFSVRQFAADNNSILVCQSLAKNFGLYGLRTGCLSILASSCEEKNRVLSQLKILARTSYSNPPLHGARLAEEVLRNSDLQKQWREELKAVSERMKNLRSRFRAALLKFGSKNDWKHLVEQQGMFCYTGLTESQVKFLRKEWHVYLTDDGRLSVPSLNEKNVDYVAEAVHSVSR